jgi:ADP-heptose:LPS heptosyltransferase
VSSPPAIVVLQNASQLGDALTQLAAFRAMRQAWPGRRIILLATMDTVYAGILAPVAEGLIDEVVSPTRLTEDPLALAAWLDRLGEVEAMFDLRSNLKSTKSWLAAWGRSRRYCANVVGYVLRHGTGGLFDPRPVSNGRRAHRMVEVAAGRTLAYDPALAPFPAAAAAAERLLPAGGGPYLGVAPGGSWSGKAWPLRRHVALVRAAPALGLTPVYVLGPHEGADLETVRRAAPGVMVLEAQAAGGDPTAFLWLTHAAAARMTVVVASEGGLGHLVATTGTPLVTLSGPTNMPRWRPAARRWWNLRAQDFSGGAERMDDIPAEAVVELLATILPELEAPEARHAAGLADGDAGAGRLHGRGGAA